MSKFSNAIAATSPHFRESDLKKELESRGLKNVDILIPSLRGDLRRAKRDFHTSKVPIRALTR